MLTKALALKPFNSVGKEEAEAAHNAVLKGPLSGFLGGMRTGGYHVEALEADWKQMFGCRHAVSCNSATSGLLMACHAAGVKRDTIVRTTPYTMSGTAAPAAILGARLIFGDIDEDIFCLKPASNPGDITISVNLFGHPSNAHPGCFVIEDAAQSILASRYGKRLNADITVFSGNIHKAVQCGEGGMCCTNDDTVADKMRMFRNHGELAGFPPGLNLRLTEVQAAIWRMQLYKAEKIVSGRWAIAECLSEYARTAGLGVPPVIKEGCTHSFYIWALRCKTNRDTIARALQAEGFPCRAGYVTPLYKLTAFKQLIRRHNVEDVESNIIVYENCAFDPSLQQLQQIKDIFQKVADANRG